MHIYKLGLGITVAIAKGFRGSSIFVVMIVVVVVVVVVIYVHVHSICTRLGGQCYGRSASFHLSEEISVIHWSWACCRS